MTGLVDSYLDVGLKILPGHPFLRLMVQDEIETALTIFWLSNHSQTTILSHIAKNMVAFGANIDSYLTEDLRGNIDLQNRAVVVKWLEMLNLKCRVLGYLGDAKLSEPHLLLTKKDFEFREVEISSDEVAFEHGWGPMEVALKSFDLVNEIAGKHDIVIPEAEIKFGYDQAGSLVLAGGVLTYWDENQNLLDSSEVLRRLTC